MPEPTPKKNYKVAVLIYDGADILDFTGPMQVMSHVSHQDDPDPVFEVKTIAQKIMVHTSSSLHIEPDIWLTDALDSIAEYDILIVLGASLSTLQKMIKDANTPFADTLYSLLVLVSSSRSARVHDFSGQPAFYPD